MKIEEQKHSIISCINLYWFVWMFVRERKTWSISSIHPTRRNTMKVSLWANEVEKEKKSQQGGCTKSTRLPSFLPEQKGGMTNKDTKWCWTGAVRKSSTSESNGAAVVTSVTMPSKREPAGTWSILHKAITKKIRLSTPLLIPAHCLSLHHHPLPLCPFLISCF